MSSFRSACPDPPAALLVQEGKAERFALFFVIPREVRDMIYLQFPGVAWIDVTQSPAKTFQPPTALVNKQMRQEALDIFYGANAFLLDMRGWKNKCFPKHVTPPVIFRKWIGGIGEQNAGRLRSLSFYSHNFSAHVKLSELAPWITLKWRASAIRSCAEDQPNYTFTYAASIAYERVKAVTDCIVEYRQGLPLAADDIMAIATVLQRVQPYLCTRMSLGFKGMVFGLDSEEWADETEHLKGCDDCGYMRAAT